MVSFSCRISPLTLTVIFFERSPRATAVATSAMLRTCAGQVRRHAELTLSVRSFQVPATPGTCAWPPSLPSVPTSRATRVTSPAKRVELVHHRVDGVLQLEDLAAHVDGDLRERSPLATAVVTSAMLRTCAGQVAGHGVDAVGEVLPGARRRRARWPGRRARPSVPTSRATRVTSPANALQLIDHRVDGLLRAAGSRR